MYQRKMQGDRRSYTAFYYATLATGRVYHDNASSVVDRGVTVNIHACNSAADYHLAHRDHNIDMT